MSIAFRCIPGAAAVVVSCVRKAGLFSRASQLATDDWLAAGADRAVVRALIGLANTGAATKTATTIDVPVAEAARLAADVIDKLGLPPLADVGLVVSLHDRVEKPDGRLILRWTDRDGLQIRPERLGLVVSVGGKPMRLSAAMLAVAEAADAYNATIGAPLEARVTAWMPMQAALQEATGAEIKRDGFLDTFTLYQAGAFALDVHEDETFSPVLMRRAAVHPDDEAPAADIDADIRSAEEATPERPGAAPLLSAEDQRSFHAAFLSGSRAKDAYSVGHNRYVLIDPSLKRALDVVHSVARADPTERRAFLRNPRAAIEDALDPDGDGASAASLFVETQGYSDRVAGLGLWEKPKLPWLTRTPTTWLPEGGWGADGSPFGQEPLTEEEIAAVERACAQAEETGQPHVVIRGIAVPIDDVPRVIEAERQRRAQQDDAPSPPSPSPEPEPSAPREVLLLDKDKTNFDAVGYVLALRPRSTRLPQVPPTERLAKTALQPHQVDGFSWLVQAWSAGWPGVLLADDMGLGKTFQALAFMAWLREHGVRTGADKPFLVVAPTALLKNWEKEARDRLAPDALGPLVAAFGRGLRDLKLAPDRRSDPGETLDRERLRRAGWILTTYETLTDHERAFAPIEYALVVFDEMQKIKAPDTLNTKTAKILNANFVLGLTGTPIENRMEDLWSLFDRLIPGYLSDLKRFSTAYSDGNPERLRELKAQLDSPVSGAPPTMLRRMKHQILVGLPRKDERQYPTPMPEVQRQQYEAFVNEAVRRRERSPGFMLQVLHGMRGLSLHPDDASKADVSTGPRFQAFANRSARLTALIAILRTIHARREKALIFIEFLAMQEAVASGVGALFDLKHPIDVIHGGIPGEKRLDIVERFSGRGPGFDVLVLSPRAAGIGLNITAANHVIHLSRWWNPAVEDQCNDRAYRMGQTRDVTVHVPLATLPGRIGESFDERLDQLLQRKRALSRDMLMPPESVNDVETLFGETIRP